MKKVLLSMAMLSLVTFGFSQINSTVGTVNPKAKPIKSIANMNRSINAPVATLTACPNDGTAGNPNFGVAIPDLTTMLYQPASIMSNYTGNEINKISVGIHTGDITGDLTLKIWTDTTNFGATAAYEQVVPYANLVDGWNDIILTTPFAVDGSALAFGYTVNSTAGLGAAYDNTALASDSLGSTIVSPTYAYRGMLIAGANQYLSFSIKAYVDDGSNFVDAEITNATIPNWNCDLGATEECTATIKNNGTAATGAFTLGYVLNTDAEVQINVPSIDPSASTTVNFNVDMSTAGQGYSVKMYTQLSGDEDHNNDTSNVATIHTIPNTVVDGQPYDVQFIGSPTYDFMGMNAEDVNADGSTWFPVDFTANGLVAHSGDMGLIYVYNSNNAADDYYYTNCLDLAANHYTLTFWTKVADDGATPPVAIPEKLDVKLGMGQDATAMSQTLVDLGELTNTDWVQTTVNFEVTAAGTYNIGFHAYSDADKFLLMVDDIHLEVDLNASASSVLENSFNIYPNPTTGLVNIENAENATVMVYNQVGALIETVSNTNQIDLSSFDNGVYIVKVIANNNTSVKRIVLTK